MTTKVLYSSVDGKTYEIPDGTIMTFRYDIPHFDMTKVELIKRSLIYSFHTKDVKYIGNGEFEIVYKRFENV
jgi:hypothetical protein